MPFTIHGEWVPAPSNKKGQSIKIYKEKRRGSCVTLISNASEDVSLLKTLCSSLKQQLGCGGSIKEGKIELQGDQVEAVKTLLKELGLKLPP